MSRKILCPIYRHARRNPDAPAIICDNDTISYRRFNAMVEQHAADFKAQGVKRGIRMGTTLSNSAKYITILAALWRLGAIAVPINYRFPSSYVESIFQKLRIDCGFQMEGYDENAILRYEENSLSSPPQIDLDAAATIILTSGSTAAEKAVVHTYGNHYYNALGSNKNIPLAPGDRWLLSLPLFHVGGLGILFRSFLAGATVVVPEPEEPLEEAIAAYAITHLSLVSTHLYRLLDGPGALESNQLTDSFLSLKAVLLGGSAFPESLIRKATILGFPIHTTYGLSETASQVTTTPVGATPEQLLTSGKLLKYRRLRIDRSGEIQVSGRVRFLGYWAGDTLLQPFDQDGWFATGDLGRIDESGFLKVLGRKDNMFVSGGENIMPEEIEKELIFIPGIEEALVAPVAHEQYGQRPVAFIKTLNPERLTRDYVIQHLEEKLPRYKIPDTFYKWPEPLVESASLKIRRPYFSELLLNPEHLTLLFAR